MLVHLSSASPALTTFQITYSPAHRPNGMPLDPHASRQAFAERRVAHVRAAHADAAVWMFERDNDRMATACRRLQDDVDAALEVEGDEETA
jgi:hypothetical protein